MSMITRDPGRVPNPASFLDADLTDREEHEEKWDSQTVALLATVFLGAAVVMAIVGAPIIFPLALFVVGIVFLLTYFRAHEWKLDEHYRELVEQDEARQRHDDEVNLAIRATLRGSIKLRCRYCGMLNDESDDECESCGAPL